MMAASGAPSQAPPVAAPPQPSPKAGPPVSAASPPPAKPLGRNNPFIGSTSKNPTLAANSTDPTPQLTQPAGTQAQGLPECLIPGCGKPVHIDSSGSKTSEYCSMRHREYALKFMFYCNVLTSRRQAVTDGLVSPCIMCLSLPQSDTDYFCSRECREEAMSKGMET